MCSLLALSPAICGLPDTGPTVPMDTIGFPEHGLRLRAWACCGPLVIGDGAAEAIFGTQDIGARTLAFTAASTTVSGMAVSDLVADIGVAATTSTTGQSRT